MASAHGHGVRIRICKKCSDLQIRGEKVKNGVGAEVAYVPVGSYSAVGVDGVAYVIANDKSITKDMICQGEAAETTFCK